MDHVEPSIKGMHAILDSPVFALANLACEAFGGLSGH